jgi:hypothetical protein
MQAYAEAGVTLKRGEPVSELVKDLQRDLRQLGYLKGGLDGVFESETELAIHALQYDLMSNEGKSHGKDGNAPVRMVDYNRGRVWQTTGVLDPLLTSCMVEMLLDGRFPKLPFSDNAAAENAKAVAAIKAIAAPQVPLPFLFAILGQESNLRHFAVPSTNDADNFIVVGLDKKANDKRAITSRGYGIGQYTLFHHPARPEEISDFMLDPVRNVERAVSELLDKFNHFIVSDHPSARADDRYAEHGQIPLRTCKYAPNNPNYLRDCRACIQEAGPIQEIVTGVTSLYAGSTDRFEPTLSHPQRTYSGVPIRAKILCDWPYAARRYNGSGLDSYHYQVQVLRRVLNGN